MSVRGQLAIGGNDPAASSPAVHGANKTFPMFLRSWMK
jgi:hypothetical protein